MRSILGYGVRRSSCRAHIEMMHYAALKEDPVCCTIAAASRPLYAHYTCLSKTVLANSKGLLSGFCRTWHQQATETTAHCRMAEMTLLQFRSPWALWLCHSLTLLPLCLWSSIWRHVTSKCTRMTGQPIKHRSQQGDLKVRVYICKPIRVLKNIFFEYVHRNKVYKMKDNSVSQNNAQGPHLWCQMTKKRRWRETDTDLNQIKTYLQDETKVGAEHLNGWRINVYS